MSLRIRDIQIDNTGIPRRIGVVALKVRKEVIEVSDQGKDSGDVQNPAQNCIAGFRHIFTDLKFYPLSLALRKSLSLKT